MRDLNLLQMTIMVFVKGWANNQKTPIPRREIMRYMMGQKVKDCTAVNAINSLLEKGYIRRAYSEKANISLYVMIRNI